MKEPTKKGWGPKKAASTADENDILAECRACGKWDEIKGRMRMAETIAKSVDSVQDRIKNGEFKPTVGEYLKLVQMEHELEQQEAEADGPKEIKVTWVEPPIESKPEP